MSDTFLLLVGAGIGLGLGLTALLVRRLVRRAIDAAVALAVADLEARITLTAIEKALGMVRDITQTRASAPVDIIRDHVLAEKEMFALGAQRDLLADIRREMQSKGDA